jgi:hypothetical protein
MTDAEESPQGLFAEAFSQEPELADVNLLSPYDFATIAAGPLAADELPTIEKQWNSERWSEDNLHNYHAGLRKSGRLRPELEDLAAFTKHYNRLRTSFAQAVWDTFDVPSLNDYPERARLGIIAAANLAFQVAYDDMELLGPASARFALDTDQTTYKLEVRGGLEYSLPAQNRQVIEYGPGLIGGEQRIRECAGGIWSGVFLVNNNTLPHIFSKALAQALEVPADKIEASQIGMAATSEKLVNDGVQADVIVATKIGNAEGDELRPAIRRSRDLLVAGGALVLGDFMNHRHGMQLFDWAGEALGDPVVVHETPHRATTMRSAVFIKQ